MAAIEALYPEIERRLSLVKDHVLHHDTGALNSTEIAILKGDVMQLVIVINILVGYLRAEARAADFIAGIEDELNRRPGRPE